MHLPLKISGLAMIGLLIAACGSESSTIQLTASSIPEQTGTTAPSVSALTTTTVMDAATTTIGGATTAPVYPVAPLSALTAYKLDYDRLGPIVVGMTLGEATTASGVEFREDRWDSVTGCTTAFPSDGHGVWMILLDGRIAAIHAAAPITTVRGAGVGTAEDQIVHLYADASVEVSDHPYGGSQWHVIAVTSSDPALEPFSLVFDTDGSVVTDAAAGTTYAARLAEGCA
jgi:hypothetical protein